MKIAELYMWNARFDCNIVDNYVGCNGIDREMLLVIFKKFMFTECREMKKGIKQNKTKKGKQELW